MSTKFEIAEGEVWAGNIFKRHWNGVSGLAFGDRFEWRMQVDMSDCPDGTTIKLCGIAMIPFSFNRVRLDGWNQLFSFTHEDSDRFLATKQGTDIVLKSYSYRNGYGPSTETDLSEVPFDSFSKEICSVPNGSIFTASIAMVDGFREGTKRHDGKGSLYVVKSAAGTKAGIMPRNGDSARLKHRTFAHAKGYKQESAPGNIHINVF